MISVSIQAQDWYHPFCQEKQGWFSHKSEVIDSEERDRRGCGSGLECLPSMCETLESYFLNPRMNPDPLSLRGDNLLRQVYWCTSAIMTLGRQKQENCSEFKFEVRLASKVYSRPVRILPVRLYLMKTKTKIKILKQQPKKKKWIKIGIFSIWVVEKHG